MSGSWCDKQKVDAFRCEVIKILDYTAFLFEKGCEYITTGCHRWTISSFHGYVDEKHIGQHPEVCALVGFWTTDNLSVDICLYGAWNQ